MLLSANKAKIVKPCGSNLYLEIFNIVTLAALAMSLITFSKTLGSNSFEFLLSLFKFSGKLKSLL